MITATPTRQIEPPMISKRSGCTTSIYQPAHFGRVYAAYGGWFVVLSLLWGWYIDGIKPDRFDIIGGSICLVGVAVIMYAPRLPH